MDDMSSERRNDGIRRAVAAREHGRSKVRSTTTAVTVASVVTAGALALALPGSPEDQHIQRIELHLGRYQLHGTSSGSTSGQRLQLNRLQPHN